MVAACGGAPASNGSAKLTPPPPEETLPSFVRTAPKGTRLLARVPGDKLGALLARDHAAPLNAVLAKCGIDPRRDVERVELALAHPFGVRADVHGRVSAEGASCLVAELLGGDADAVVTRDVTGGVRVATAAALEDGPGAPEELARAIADATEADAVIAAQLDDHAAASLVVVQWNETVEVRARLARGGAEAVEAWWKSAVDKLDSRPLERLEVRASGGELYVRMALSDSVLGAVALAMAIRRVLEPFEISSLAMAPSLLIGDHVFVDKTSTELERGGTKTFRFPENQQQVFISRVIGLGGETVEVLDGRPIINGWLVPHCHIGRLPISDHEPDKTAEVYLEMLGERAYLTAYDETPTATGCKSDRDCSDGRLCRARYCGTLQGPFKVRAGEAFVLGDNRNNSHDSRTWFGGLGGGVPSANIIGTPKLIWASFGPGGLRWERMLVTTDVPRLPRASAALAACLDKKQPAQPPKTKR